MLLLALFQTFKLNAAKIYDKCVLDFNLALLTSLHSTVRGPGWVQRLPTRVNNKTVDSQVDNLFN
jgi:hypothetical protein